MNFTKPCLRFVGWLLFLALGFTARAATLLDVSSSLSNSDPTQLGRLTRNAIPSDWSVVKPFPGVTASANSFHFHTFTVPAATIGSARFIQISVDDANAAIFATAYDTAYSPNPGAANRGLDINLVGDAGATGNSFGNQRFFQALPAAGHDLVVVIGDISTANAGIGKPFRLLVEGFTDTLYTEPAPLRISSLSLSETNLVLNGANGLAGRNCVVLMSPKVTLPLNQWTALSTNLLAANGNFTITVTNTVSHAVPQQFYRLQLQ